MYWGREYCAVICPLMLYYSCVKYSHSESILDVVDVGPVVTAVRKRRQYLEAGFTGVYLLSSSLGNLSLIPFPYRLSISALLC